MLAVAIFEKWQGLQVRQHRCPGSPPSCQVGLSIVMGVPPMDGFVMEKPTKMDDLGVALFQEASIYKWDSPFGGLTITRIITALTIRGMIFQVCGI